jgi:hypothetical protein
MQAVLLYQRNAYDFLLLKAGQSAIRTWERIMARKNITRSEQAITDI